MGPRSAPPSPNAIEVKSAYSYLEADLGRLYGNLAGVRGGVQKRL
jgi:hypothetical protein